MAVLDNLVAYWSLEEASGTRNDAHGTSHLTDNNTVTSATGKVGTAADFELSNAEYLEVADNAALSMGDIDFSIACWVNLESKAAPMVIVSKYQGSNLEYQLNYDNGGDVFRFFVASGASFANATSVPTTDFGAPSTSTWYFVTARHDATANTIDIGVNAGTQTSAAYTFGSWDSGSFLRLGGNPDNQWWDGLIDEVGIWKKKLTADEITWLYNAGAGRSYADIVAAASTGQPASKRLSGVIHAVGAQPLGIRRW